MLIYFDCKVQRALKLWATGAITLQMVMDAKPAKGNKGMTLPKVMVNDNGTQESTSFNDATWGSIARTRMEFVNNSLRSSSLEKVIQKAKVFMVANHAGGSRSTSDAMDIDGTYTQMVDLSDPDSECKWN